jgi:hypothetical protein
LCLDNPTLPKITAVATDWPACARLSMVAPAGHLAASYTTTRDTTEDTAPALRAERHEVAFQQLRRITEFGSNAELKKGTLLYSEVHGDPFQNAVLAKLGMILTLKSL